MKSFMQGSFTVFTVIITAVVIFPLVPLWTFSIWIAGDDDLIDSAADAFDAYLKIIHIE